MILNNPVPKYKSGQLVRCPYIEGRIRESRIQFNDKLPKVYYLVVTTRGVKSWIAEDQLELVVKE